MRHVGAQAFTRLKEKGEEEGGLTGLHRCAGIRRRIRHAGVYSPQWGGDTKFSIHIYNYILSIHT